MPPPRRRLVVLGLLLLAAVVAAWLVVLHRSYQRFAVRNANATNTNWGNMLDRVLLLYVAAEGDPQRFRALRAAWLPNTAMYGDADFPPADADADDGGAPADRRRLTRTERAFVAALFTPLYRWGALWYAPTSAKRIARPYARRCLERRVASVGPAVRGDAELATTIVVHVRCSDVPFVRLPLYHLYSCEWYGRALRAAFAREAATLGAGRRFTRILLVTCAAHIDPAGPLAFLMPAAAVARARCADFRDQYLGFFRRAAAARRGVSVATACGTPVEDLYRMHRAGCLIACTGSFAYYAGYLSDNLFVVPELFAHGYVRPGMVTVPGGRIAHLRVRDYLDGPEMEGHLRCR